MAKIIAIAQQKGGTGKTTTAHAIGAGLSKKGRKVLFVDLDGQGNLSFIFAAVIEKTALDILTKRAKAKDVIQKTPAGHIIPAGRELAGADNIIIQTGKEYRLKEALNEISKYYDYIILDTPPALGILTVNALTAAHEVVIPAQADVFSLQATTQIAETVQTIRRYCNPELKIKGILVTRYNSRQILSRETVDMLSETAAKYGTKVFDIKIRETVTIREAQISQKDIYSYAAGSNAAEDYKKLIKEIL